MSDRDDYLRIPGRVQYVRPHAVLFTVGDTVPRAAWIPRALIHGADDKQLTEEADSINAMRGQGGMRMTLRMFRWKAEEIGFTSAAGYGLGSLFDGEPDF